MAPEIFLLFVIGMWAALLHNSAQAAGGWGVLLKQFATILFYVAKLLMLPILIHFNPSIRCLWVVPAWWLFVVVKYEVLCATRFRDLKPSDSLTAWLLRRPGADGPLGFRAVGFDWVDAAWAVSLVCGFLVAMAARRFGSDASRLSPEVIVELAQDAGSTLDDLTSLTDEAAEAVAQCDVPLSLDGLTTLSDGAAAALALQKGQFLSLNGLLTLSDNAATALAQHKGYLSLDGLTTLSDAQAEALARHAGDLRLRGLTTLSPEAAAALRANPAIVLPDNFKR